MKIDQIEITIDGIKYVRADSIDSVPVSDSMVIVRSKSAGVFYGELMADYDDTIKTGRVNLSNARRCWYWSGAASLSQLAIDGTSKPKDCKFPAAVPKIQI